MPRRRTVSASSAAYRSPKRPRVENNVTESRSTRDALLGGSDSVGRFHLRSDEDFVATARVLKNVEDSGSELRPRSVSLLPKENGHAHHTEEYDCSELVLRRGQDFDMSITFDRKFNPETDQLTLQLTTGSRPIESKGTVIRIDVADTIDRMTMNWQAKFADDEVEGDTLNLLVWSPCDAIVGRYRLFLETRCQEGDSIWCSRKEMPDSFLLVFNPWCKADSVFLEEEELRAEYVLNETGRIWQGSARSHHGQPWNFGQFESVCINAALYLLDKAELSDGARSNTVLVVRTLSQMSNSNDADGGVLTGRWTDAYPKTSTVPWAWSGSVAILEEFMKTKKAVCYGQCWVFSGLVTTLCRALGIPTRSVTNFESAHDCDGSVTIDYHWNEKDKPIVDENDSVWNFHVWNESWMRRTDLPDGYDGWQAHDATPQEASEGVMKCGPAPVQAIKDGNVYLPYDSKFIFAEVNGDKVHWLVKDNGCMSVLNVDMRSVGINMSTKSVGSTLREDITENYKFPEGSPEERKAVYRAFRHSSRRELPVYNVDPPDVLFELDCPDQVTLGEDFEIKVDLKNEIAEDRTVHIQLTAIASFYTGVTSKSVGTQEFDELVPAKETKTITLPVKHAVYQKFLQPESLVTVFVKGTVKETERSFARIDTIRLNKPEIALMHPEKVTINEEFEVHIKFTNPLDEKLTNGCFHIEGHGFTTPRMVLYKKVIGPGESVSHTINLSAHRSGTRELIVNFSSDQLVGLTGSAEVYVSYGG